MTTTLELDPTLVARAEAQAAREGLTLARLIERLMERGLDARLGPATGIPARTDSSAEPWRRFNELGPASEQFEAAIREARVGDAAADERRRARIDALWADES